MKLPPETGEDCRVPSVGMNNCIGPLPLSVRKKKRTSHQTAPAPARQYPSASERYSSRPPFRDGHCKSNPFPSQQTSPNARLALSASTPPAPAKMPRGALTQSAPPFPSGHKKRSDLVGRPRLNVCFTARKALPSKPLLDRRGLGWLSASVGGVPPIQGQTPKLLQVHGGRPVPR